MKATRPHRFQAILLLATLVVVSGNLGAQETSGPAQGATATPDSATPVAAKLSLQYEAMGKYPELARAGSPFNVEFLARVRRYRVVNLAFFQNERWPVALADEVAAAGFPSAMPTVAPSAPYPVGGTGRAMPSRNMPSGRTVAAPAGAPPVVHAAVEAGNLLQNKPYKWGGGHAWIEDSGYDCSGSVSYVLRKAGLLGQALTSRGFASYGIPDRGAGSPSTQVRAMPS